MGQNNVTAEACCKVTLWNEHLVTSSPYLVIAISLEGLKGTKSLICLFYTLHSSHYDIQSHPFMANRWGNSGNSDRLYFWGLQNHCRWWLQPWIKRCLLLRRKVMINLAAAVAKSLLSCPTLCDPRNHSTPGLPVLHQLPESAQTHVHRISDAIQPSHPLSFPSPPAPNLSQHQSLFQRVGSSHQVAKVLELQLQHQSFQWIFTVDFL